MLLANSVDTTSFQTLNRIAIGCLQRSKDCDITWLKLVGSVGGEAAQADVVNKTVLQNLERLVGAEAVADQ
jgi:hypothetical protein